MFFFCADYCPQQELHQPYVDQYQYDGLGKAMLASLPPEAQRQREINEILNDSRLLLILESGETVQCITKVASGYVVLTDRHSIQVDVRYLPFERGFCGPDRFELVFYPPEQLG